MPISRLVGTAQATIAAEDIGAFEDIFPAEPRREHVQSEWTRGGRRPPLASGKAAERLSEEARSFGPCIDQVGLAVSSCSATGSSSP